MSRFSDNEWDGEGPPPEFWWQAARSALKGRRGQAALRELKAALLALPRPRLIEGALARNGEVCALGALAKKRLAAGETFKLSGDEIRSTHDLEIWNLRWGEPDEWDSMELGEQMGLRRTLAWLIAYENDEGGGVGTQTEEARYNRIMHWIDQNLE